VVSSRVLAASKSSQKPRGKATTLVDRISGIYRDGITLVLLHQFFDFLVLPQLGSMHKKKPILGSNKHLPPSVPNNCKSFQLFWSVKPKL
jgi:hypothetical protein